MRRLSLTALALLASTASAQETTYTPKYELPQQPQLLAFYIGASDCRPCTTPELKAAIHAMKPALLKQATDAGQAFEAIGVALDWEIQKGLDLLQPLEEYDEVSVGSNWANLAAVRYIWSDTTATPGLPQVVLVERHVLPGARSIGVGPERILGRVVGADAIERWVAQGALVSKVH